jgi:hypothetical protein
MQPVSGESAATVVDVHFFSVSIDAILCYRAIVPKVALGERLPMLYLRHGANSGPVEMTERSRS